MNQILTLLTIHRALTQGNRSTSDKIKLWCWVQGDKRNRIFDVKIEPSADVNELKEAVKDKKPSFKDRVATD